MPIRWAGQPDAGAITCRGPSPSEHRPAHDLCRTHAAQKAEVKTFGKARAASQFKGLRFPKDMTETTFLHLTSLLIFCDNKYS